MKVSIALCVGLFFPLLAPASITWESDYKTASRRATEEKKEFLIYFKNPIETEAAKHFEKEVLSSEEVEKALGEFVLLKVGTDYMLGDKPLLHHASFGGMMKSEGIATVDLTDEKQKHYGLVTGEFPFVTLVEAPGIRHRGVPYGYLNHYAPWRKSQFLTILGLPYASQDVRALVFAVRIHPDGFPCTMGKRHGELCSVCERNNIMQGRLGGGHHVMTVGEQISAPTFSQHATQAAMEAVAGWNASPSHRSSLARRFAHYGFSLVRDQSGKFWATGMFR